MSFVRGLRVRRIAGVLSAFAAVASVHCSLGLDASRVNGLDDGGVLADGTVSTDGAVIPLVDTGIPVGPDAGSCTSDDGCKSANGCLKGKCDLTRNACVYDVCRASACQVSSCDPAAKTCGVPAVAYKFKATQFSLGAPIACVECAVAMYPWLFVILPTGLVAFNISSPTASPPPAVPIVGLGFVPVRIVKTGGRLWIHGSSSGAQTSRIPLATIDVPDDPFTAKIVAQSFLAAYNRPGAEGVFMFPRASDSALIVGPATSQFASTIVQAPLTEPLTLTATPSTFLPGMSPNAASGKRLLMSSLTAGSETFNLVDNAGGPGQVNGLASSVPGTDLGTARAFSASTDGAIFMAQSVNEPSAVVDQLRTHAARGYFLVANATAPLDTRISFDVEVYSANLLEVPPNAPILGPSAMVDAKTAVVLTQAHENERQTAVQFVRREGGVVKEADATTPRRQLLNVPVGAFVAATASNGVVYLVANDQPAPAPGTVFVFDPACAP